MSSIMEVECQKVGGSPSCCLICCGSGGGELYQDIKLFALRYLLEIPADLLEKWSGSGELKTSSHCMCDLCSDQVREGLELYRQLVITVDKFRRIQRELVEKARLGENYDGTWEWRKSVIDNDYDFAGPFKVHPEFGMDGEDVKEEEPEVSIDAESEDSDDEGLATLSDPLGFEMNPDTPVKSESEDDESDEVEENVEDCPDNRFLNEDSDGGNEWSPPPKVETSDKEEDSFGAGSVRSRKSPRKRKLTTRLYYETDDEKDEGVLPNSKKSNSRPTGAFKCPMEDCSKTYKFKQDVDRHLRKHHGIVHHHHIISSTADISCELCGDNIPRQDLLAHVRDHVGKEYLQKCPNPDCALAFLHSFALRKHLGPRNKACRAGATPALLDNIKKGCYVCDLCGTGSPNIDVFQAHLDTNHELSAKSIKCPISGCELTFCVRQSVEVHIAKGHVLSNNSTHKMQKCADCAKKVNLADIEEHLRQAHGVTDSFKCPQCPSLYSTREHLIHHLFTSHRHSGIPFPCDICSGHGDKDPTFSDHLSLRQHYFEAHGIGQKFVCEHCQGEYWTRTLFENHVNYVHNKKQLTCDICEGLVTGSSPTFGSKDTLQGHKIKVHGAEPYKCPHCPQTFTANQTLQIHIRNEHRRKVKPVFPCTISGCSCGGRSYSTKKALTGHQVVVLGESKHVCDECGKQFRDSRHLKKHQDMVHLKIRTVICDTCGEGFFNQHLLNRHALIHSGERPFVCSKCGQRFRQNSVLGRHLKAHEEKGDSFRPTGPMKHIRKRVENKK